MASAAAVRDHTPESIRLEVRSGARAEAAYLRSIGAAALQPEAADEAFAAPKPRPRLVVVPRRTRALRTTTVLFTVTFLAFMSLAAFQVVVAQQQISLDRSNRAAQLARERFDELRQQNAALRNPERLADSAHSYGFLRFRRGPDLQLTGRMVAEVVAQSGVVSEPSSGRGLLARHQQLKRILAAARGEVTP